MKKIFTIILLVFTVLDAYSQRVPERSDVRKGNSLFKKGNFSDAETEYRRALQKNPQSANAKYNLANSIYRQANNETNALYRQARYEAADSLYKSLIKSSIDSTRPPQTYHNLGNSTLKQAIKDKEKIGQHVQANQEKLKESIEAYKKALKLNPSDMETKSNLAYAQKLLSKNENGGGGGGGNDNQQNQDKNQDKNQNKNDDEQNNDKQDNQDKQNKQDDKKEQNQQQEMSKQDIDRMLEAVREQEEKTKEKVDKKKADAAKKYTPEKNW